MRRWSTSLQSNNKATTLSQAKQYNACTFRCKQPVARKTNEEALKHTTIYQGIQEMEHLLRRPTIYWNPTFDPNQLNLQDLIFRSSFDNFNHFFLVEILKFEFSHQKRLNEYLNCQKQSLIISKANKINLFKDYQRGTDWSN